MKRKTQRREKGVGELPFHAHADHPIRQRREAWEGPPQVATPRKVAPLTPKTEAQERYIAAMHGKHLTIGTGPAGTGKSFCSVSVACEMLAEGKIEKILITRPAVTSEEDLGFLPGGVSEKFSPYFAPVEEILNERLGASYVKHAIKSGVIVAMPIGFMRGHTFKKSFVILDEAQNTTPGQMKMILTRFGQGSRFVVEGDVSQSDLPCDQTSGLADLIHRFRHHRDVGRVDFTRADVVRHGFVQDVLDLYERPSGHTAPYNKQRDIPEDEDVPLPASILSLCGQVG